MTSESGQVNFGHNHNHCAVTSTSSSTSKRVGRFSDRWSAVSRLIRASRGRPSKEKVHLAEAFCALENYIPENDVQTSIDAMGTENGRKTVWPKLPQTSPQNPSPLSGLQTASSKPIGKEQFERHSYPNRGYTRSALNYVKRAWEQRWEQWVNAALMAWSDVRMQ